MSTNWSGFSEDDIKKLKSGNNQSEVVENKQKRFIKAKRRTDNVKPKSSQIHKITDGIYDISEDAKLSEPPLTPVLNKPVEPLKPEINGINEQTNNNEECINISSNSITLDLTKIEKKVIDLDEFQARQKRIEEQNRRRKELLAKALADRTKQTEEEAQRLKEIQNEFKKLDALLSNDVAILRHQIEIASLDFMEAQKRYHKVEKEFLDAKLTLHQKLEKKEMLTEHLCAIIEKNEERKADKLNELLSRLTINDKSNSDTTLTDNNTSKNLESQTNISVSEKSNNENEIKSDSVIDSN